MYERGGWGSFGVGAYGDREGGCACVYKRIGILPVWNIGSYFFQDVFLSLV